MIKAIALFLAGIGIHKVIKAFCSAGFADLGRIGVERDFTKQELDRLVQLAQEAKDKGPQSEVAVFCNTLSEAAEFDSRGRPQNPAARNIVMIVIDGRFIDAIDPNEVSQEFSQACDIALDQA